MNKDYIFISHSTQDKPIADAICHYLEENHFRCWIAPRDIHTTDWASSIMQGIHKSDVFVIIVSRNSIASGEVTKEITEASRVCRYILPFKVDEEMLNDRMRYHLGPCHWLDAINPPLEVHIKELTERIKNLSSEDAVYMNRECVSLAEKMCYPRELFVGRDAEIEEIRQRLSENHILFLEGMGGIGKSEIAKAYAKKYYKQYDTIIFATYVSDIMNMVCSDELPVRNIKRAEEESQEHWFYRKLEVFHMLSSDKTLLVVDNFDVDQDIHLQELLSCSCHFLITSRNQHPDYPTLPISRFRNFEDVRKVFINNYNKPLKEQELKVVDEILHLVDCHTITVELIAKQMRASFLRPEKMLERLHATGMNLHLKEKIRRDGTTEKLTAFDYICQLFSLSGVSEEEKSVLRCMTLVPTGGIKVELLGELLALDDYDTLNSLINKSWLHLDEENDMIRMHPVICDVVREQLHPTQISCQQYIHQLYLKMRNCWFFTVEERNELYPYVFYLLQLFPTPVKELFEEYCSFINVPWICGDFEYAQKTGLVVYDFTVKAFGEKSFEAGEAALSLAAAYHNAGDDQSAEPWYKLSLDILLANGGQPSGALAKSYMKVGRCAFFRGDYTEAQEYYDKSMEIYDILIANHDVYDGRDYPDQYEDIFVELERLRMAEGKYEEALALCQRSYQLINEIHGEDSSSSAYSLVDMGICYSMLGEYEKAEQYLNHALAVNQEKNDKASIQTARTREALADNEIRRNHPENAQSILFDLLMDLENYFGADSPLTMSIAQKAELLQKQCGQ